MRRFGVAVQRNGIATAERYGTMKGIDMKHCQQCNLDFLDSFWFCGSCGGSLPDSLTCQGCGDLVESKWTFCTNCGKQLSSQSISEEALSLKTPKCSEMAEAALASSSGPASSPSHGIPLPLSGQPSEKAQAQEWYAATDLFREDDESTVTPSPRQELVPKITVALPRATAHPQSGNGKTVPALTMLSAYGESETTAPAEWKGRHALLVGLLLLVFFGVLGFGGWYWWTHRASAAQSQAQVDSSTVPAAGNSAPAPTSAPRATKTSERTIANDPVDGELKRLREKRIGANPAEASQIIASLEEAEKKYPRDYRFPYERAKLSIKGITSHHEAFGALVLAADKGIDNGKAQEMLDGLAADKDGDFWKLSRGHHEWQALEQALRNKDRAALKTLLH